MRKKSRRRNARKFRFRSVFARRRSDSESDWVQFEADDTPLKLSPRKRIRRHLFVARLAAFACLSVSIPLGLQWGYGKVFFQNEEFVLKNLQIRTDGMLSVSRLAEVANVASGMNLMDLDLEKIQTQVATLPQVEKATVTRELPDRLRVTVRERIPVAWLSTPSLGIRPWDMERGFLLDEEGYLFRCLDLNEGLKSLPVVECFKMSEPVEGGRVEVEGVRAALKLIVQNDLRFLQDGLTIASVRASDEWAIECEYTSGLTVNFAIHDFPRGLEDLALILDRMAESGRTLASVNVAVERNIPVTFAAVAPAPVSVAPPLAEPAGVAESTSPPLVAGEPLAEVSAQEKHLRSILKGG